jgi:hypothetical protein
VKAIKSELSVRRITYEETKNFILFIHYARRMPCVQYAFGLFHKNYPFPVGVVTFGQPASPTLCTGVAGKENKRNVLELNRLVLYPEYNNGNYASFLVGHSLKMLPSKTFVVSYADWGGWHHVGYVYQATNWLYTGMTKPRTEKYSESGHQRHYIDGEMRRQLRTSKHRYVYLVGNKSEVKKMRKQLRYPIIAQYPKGNSERYDLRNPVPFIDSHKIIDMEDKK